MRWSMPVLQRAATVSGRRGLNIYSHRVGGDFRPVVIAMAALGNRHFAPAGASVVLVDRKTGRPFNDRDFFFAAGPAADERTRCRYAIFDTNSRDPTQRQKSVAVAESPASDAYYSKVRTG
jgi:hypothetical protein